MEIIKEISHRVNSNSSIFASAQIIPCYWHNTTATPSLTAHYFCSYKLYKKALSVADPGQGPSQPLICRQKWGPKGQKNFSLHCPLPPPLSPGLPPWSPLAWVSSSFTQDIGQFYSPWMKLYKSSLLFHQGQLPS